MIPLNKQLNTGQIPPARRAVMAPIINKCLLFFSIWNSFLNTASCFSLEGSIFYVTSDVASVASS